MKTREQKIEAIINDLEGWLKRDKGSFWEHVADLERRYLEEKDDKELEDIFQESM